MENVSLIPELTVSDARGAIEFYKKAFGATEVSAHATPDGKKIMHAALELNGGVVFLCDDFPERADGKSRHPRALGASPVTIHLNHRDAASVNAAWDAAVAAGARVLLPLADQFWGDRYGIVEDPYGHRWSMSAHGPKPSDDKAYREGAAKAFPTE
jgi:PhnB protein